MQESDFFRSPVGTGPYRLESWDVGQAITLSRNETYFKGAPQIEKIPLWAVRPLKSRILISPCSSMAGLIRV